MSKAQKTLLNICTLILLHIMFSMCNVYPRHILEFEANAPEIFSLISIFLNLIFFIAYDYFLILVFSRNESLFCKKFWDKSAAKKIPFVIFIQLAFDGLCMASNLLAVPWSYIIVDLSVLLQWVAIYVVLTYKNDSFSKNRKTLFAVFCTVVLITGCGFIFDSIIFSEYSAILPKYEAESPVLIAFRTNAMFWFRIKLLVFDSLLGMVLMFAHIKNISVDEQENSRKSVIALRVVLLIVAAFILTMCRNAFWPYNAIVRQHGHNSQTSNHEEYGEFDTESLSSEIYRFSMATFDVEECYAIKKTYVFKGDLEPIFVKQPLTDKLYEYASDGFGVIEHYSFDDYSDDNHKAFIYDSQVICFYEGDTPYAVSLLDLDSFEKNDTVIGVCEQALADGNVYIFEYCREYLLKYDKEFIADYIQRYSNGEFTEIEKEWMTKNYYKQEFVTGLAK